MVKKKKKVITKTSSTKKQAGTNSTSTRKSVTATKNGKVKAKKSGMIVTSPTAEITKSTGSYGKSSVRSYKSKSTYRGDLNKNNEAAVNKRGLIHSSKETSNTFPSDGGNTTIIRNTYTKTKNGKVKKSLKSMTTRLPGGYEVYTGDMKGVSKGIQKTNKKAAKVRVKVAKKTASKK